MAIKVTAKIKEAFIALPHVDEMWVTSDGHFHLHPGNGGRSIKREDVSFDAENKPAPVITDADKAVIDEIEKSQTEEEVNQFTGVGSSDYVLEVAKEKIKSLKGAKKPDGTATKK